jgi:glycosyltransferase involved in cell wall biosynthesis
MRKGSSALPSHAPKVSIGMPVYNGEPFLREALDSLLAQTFTDFELIISDNASTDKTELICKEYASGDGRIHYVRQSENKGAVVNFQIVLTAAIGRYFMWAASDDRWQANWLEILLPIAEQNDCLAFGWVNQINENGVPLKHQATNRKLSFRGSRFFRRISYAFDPPKLGKANLIYGLARREVFSASALAECSKIGLQGDMAYVHHMLNYVEAISCSTTFIEKRIWSSSEAPTVISQLKKLIKPKFLLAATRWTAQFVLLFHSSWHHTRIYFANTTLFEMLIYSFGVPLFAIRCLLKPAPYDYWESTF